jgi:cobalt/nickel transport system permease protein
MHIPDAYLSPATQAAGFVVMSPIWALSLRKVRTHLDSKHLPLLSTGAAFCFAVQMFNIPALGGTTAHALGTVLLAVLMGPWAAVLALTTSLTIQALFFGDGGILALGVNSFNMAFVAAFVGYWSFRLLKGRSEAGSMRAIISAGAAGFIGTFSASISAGIILGAQPLLAHDNAGHAMYFPFGWAVSITAMAGIHLVTAAPAEAIITGFALSYLWKNFPDLLSASKARAGTGYRLSRAMVWVIALTPLGLLAAGTGWGEWDVDKLKALVGFLPQGAAQSHELMKPVLPDYGFAGVHGGWLTFVGYMVSAAVGCTIAASCVRAFLLRKKPLEQSPSVDVPGACTSLPLWMSVPNMPSERPNISGGRWIERSLIQVRGLLATAMATDSCAGQGNPLAHMPASVKTAGLLGLLTTVSATQSVAILVGSCVMTILLGLICRVKATVLVQKPLVTTLFFGLILAAPSMLLNPGATGAYMGAVLILRLFCSIQMTTLWSYTTSWQDVLRTSRRVPLLRFFTTSVTMTRHYIFVLGMTLSEMLTARLSRQAGRVDKAAARTYMGNGAAILFAKTTVFGQHVHDAMRSRGLECLPPPRTPKMRSRLNLVWLAGGAMFVLVALLTGVFHVV